MRSFLKLVIISIGAAVIWLGSIVVQFFYPIHFPPSFPPARLNWEVERRSVTVSGSGLPCLSYKERINDDFFPGVIGGYSRFRDGFDVVFYGEVSGSTVYSLPKSVRRYREDPTYTVVTYKVLERYKGVGVFQSEIQVRTYGSKQVFKEGEHGLITATIHQDNTIPFLRKSFLNCDGDMTPMARKNLETIEMYSNKAALQSAREYKLSLLFQALIVVFYLYAAVDDYNRRGRLRSIG